MTIIDHTHKRAKSYSNSITERKDKEKNKRKKNSNIVLIIKKVKKVGKKILKSSRINILMKGLRAIPMALLFAPSPNVDGLVAPILR